ncbi:protein fmp42 [Anaeramoeba ignava]|uniref:Protein fmp42 n=1 Tax=Anaeramoeba ignava TaxID=1746090 RepID=A0A9Q0LEM5_ANAIG|nr:protein fmp42 [Anaeramoeba ignava]
MNKIILFITIILLSSTVAGVYFGWPSFAIILKKENFATENCDFTNTNKCDSQNYKIHQIFIIPSILNIVFSTVIGILIDRFGNQRSILVLSILFSIGSLFIAFSQNFAGFIIGFTLIYSNGLGMLSVVSRFCQYFSPKTQRILLCLVNGLFDSSLIMMVFFLFLYEKHFSIRTIFSSYAVYSLFVGLVSFFSSKVEKKQSEKESTPTSDLDSDVELNTPYKQMSQSEILSQKFGNLDFKHQFRSSYFWVLFAFMGSLSFFANFYLATLEQRIEFYSKSSTTTNHYVKLFSFLQLTGFLYSPFIGILGNNHLISAILSTVSAVVLIGILNTTSEVSLQIIGFLIFPLSRALIYGVNALMLKAMFGYQNLGKHLGIQISLAGIAFLLQYLISYILNQKLHGDFQYIDWFLFLITFSSIFCGIYFYQEIFKFRQNWITIDF